jgi:hypothetical protein
MRWLPHYVRVGRHHRLDIVHRSWPHWPRTEYPSSHVRRPYLHHLPHHLPSQASRRWPHSRLKILSDVALTLQGGHRDAPAVPARRWRRRCKAAVLSLESEMEGVDLGRRCRVAFSGFGLFWWSSGPYNVDWCMCCGAPLHTGCPSYFEPATYDLVRN